MNEVVILAEKPNQAKAYSEAFHVTKKEGYYEVFPCAELPNGAVITYGIGHLVELKEPHEYQGKEHWRKWKLEELPIIPDNYNFEFKVSHKTRSQFNIVKKLLNNAKEIIIATDSDREGENIARSIISLCGASNKPTKRLWINSLEKDEIIRGFKQIEEGDKYLPMYYEAQARQIGDWLVGLNASRLFTLLLQQKGVSESFSVGRVQTPTLRLIYERQKQIDNFKSEPFFELQANFLLEQGNYKGKVKQRYSSKENVTDVLSQLNIQPENVLGKIQEVKTTTKRKQPPKLHSLSSLQTLANKKYKYSPSKVLKIVQSLYDSPLKLVSYPRTDTQFITTNEFNYLRNNLEKLKDVAGIQFEPKSLEPNGRYVNNSKVQEHYAIIPTKIVPNDTTLKSLTEEQRNIYFEILNSVMAMFHHDFVYDETEIITNVNSLEFISKGKVVKSLGWKELFPSENKEDDEVLPPVDEGTSCKGQIEIIEGKTKPPKLFTEGQLINVMKFCGKYIDETDEETTEVLKNVEGLGTEATRSGIIETLKRQNYIEVKKNNVHVTKKGEILCESVEGTLLAKPDMTAKWESYLNKIGLKKGDKQSFISNVITFTNKLVTEMSVDNLNVEQTIKDIEKDKHISSCPSCKKGFIVEKGKFYGCTNYKEGCKQTFNKKILGKNITKNHIKQLCEKGKTSKIKGFKGKKEFDTHLILEKGKVKFSF